MDALAKESALVFIPLLRNEFLKCCAVGPWVSVAGREAALVRGNPALRKIPDESDLGNRKFDKSNPKSANREIRFN